MKNFWSVVLVVSAVLGGGWLTYFGPYYRDYYSMQEVVQTTALSWAAFNKERSKVELHDQLRDREIDYITPEHCDLHEDVGEMVVGCRWQVDVYPPLVGGRRLDFEVEARAGKDGRLID